MNSAVFLDRDNTLIHNDGDLGDPGQVRLIQGAASAIASLKGLGFRIVVVTNQGGVARGKYTEADVDAVNDRINQVVKTISGVGIDRFYYCPYHPEGTVEKYRREHPWRKPQPGMLLQAAKDLDLDLAQCWMVGDQQRDTDAGAMAGVRTILLTPDAEELSPLRLDTIAKNHDRRTEAGEVSSPLFTARNLVEAVRIIAQQRKPEIAAEAARNRDRGGKKWDPLAARLTRQPVAASPDTVAREEVEATQPTHAQPVDAAGAFEDHAASTDAPPAPGLASTERASLNMEKSPPPRQALDADRSAREDETLRQILQEIRQYRAHSGDFSYTKFLAVILQLVALCLFVASLWMGKESAEAFHAWMGSALFTQLTVIAALLFHR
ncbi:MAG: HAD-IIIA family hydrolase [Planctomycetes bacterium]|nr:HAD-IIIA family hydrolase [Planctomycetota bacterium]